MLRYRRHISFARVRGSPLHSCFECHWEHHYYPVTPITHVFLTKFVIGRNTACRWMLFSTTCSRTTMYQGMPRRLEVSQLHPYLGSTAACVRIGFRVRTGFRCVICLKYDQTCTAGHRPAYMSDRIHIVLRFSTHLASSQFILSCHGHHM